MSRNVTLCGLFVCLGVCAGSLLNAAAAESVVPTADTIALGARIYSGQIGGAPCSSCHGADGKGQADKGPDLTDQKWLWGNGSLATIAQTIETGVDEPEQFPISMPPMGGAKLTHDQVLAVAAYVWSLSHAAR